MQKMTDNIFELEKFTIEQFQSDFDNLMNRVEEGESFVITSEYGNAVIVPYTQVQKVFEEEVGFDDTEIVRIHTDHEEGS